MDSTSAAVFASPCVPATSPWRPNLLLPIIFINVHVIPNFENFRMWAPSFEAQKHETQYLNTVSVSAAFQAPGFANPRHNPKIGRDPVYYRR